MYKDILYNITIMEELVDIINKYSIFDNRINFITINNECYNEIKSKKNSVIHPKKKNNEYVLLDTNDKDIYFWYFFIMVHGYNDYTQLNKKYVYETNNKFTLIDKIQTPEIMKLLKANKMKIPIIVNELGNSSLSIYSLKALCIINNINIAIIKGKMCELYINSDIDQIYCLKNNKLIKYQCTKEDIIRNYILVDSINKPLKCCSSYKLLDLQNYAEQLDISLVQQMKKKTKQVLYEEIIRKLQLE